MKNCLPLMAVVLFLGLAACEDEPGCVSDNDNLVKLNFFRIDDTTARNADPAGGRYVGIQLLGAQGPARDVPGGTLPLNPAEDVSIYYLFREDGTGDTIVLRYQREQQLISPDCGPTQRFFNLSVDTTKTSLTSLDSFRLVEPELSSLTRVNLEIYTCQDEFYTQEVKLNFQEKDTLVRTDSLFIRTITDETGRVLVADDTVFGRLDLPINPQADRAVFTFELLAHGEQPARTETLTITYDQEAVQFAEHCRPQTRFFNLDTLSACTTFDSVRIENRELAEDVNLNLRIVDFIP
ncbi:MAG: DUF6452 family protein [Tunicatimonas sp.]